MTELEAERAIVTETMRFAKRQNDLFRHQAEALWFREARRPSGAAGMAGRRDGPKGSRAPLTPDRTAEISRIVGLRSTPMLLIDIPGSPRGPRSRRGARTRRPPPPGRRDVELRPAADWPPTSTWRTDDRALRGRLSGTIEVECARCLVRYRSPGTGAGPFYMPRVAEQPEAQEEEVELSDRDVVVGYYDGERLDSGVLREQVLLALPLKPLCREDCRGLCPRCGRNRNVSACGCAPEGSRATRASSPRRLIDKKRQ